MKTIKGGMPTLNSGPSRLEVTPPGHKAPSFGSLLTAHPEGPSPIADMPDLDSPEANVEAEMSEALKAIQTAKRERRDAYRTMTDPNFYLVVCFQSADQRDEFVEKARWKVNGAFVDGLKLARSLGVEVAHVALPMKTNRPMPAALRGHTVLGGGAEPESQGEEE